MKCRVLDALYIKLHAYYFNIACRVQTKSQYLVIFVLLVKSIECIEWYIVLLRASIGTLYSCHMALYGQYSHVRVPSARVT